MSKIFYANTKEEIRAMTDPYKMEILIYFQIKKDSSLTVQDIATLMNETHGKIYYHIKKLVDIGALELVSTKKINGITAKYYQVTYDEFQIGNIEAEEKSKAEDLAVDGIKAFMTKTFDTIRDQFIESLTDENFTKEDQQLKENQPSIMSFDIGFSEESYEEFLNDVQALFEKHMESPEKNFKKKIFFTMNRIIEK